MSASTSAERSLLAPDYCSQSPRPHQAVEGDLDDLLGRLLFVERAALLEPAREPVDHPEEAEGGGRRVHVLHLPRGLQLVQRAAEKVEVLPLALRDLALLRGRERRDLV